MLREVNRDEAKKLVNRGAEVRKGPDGSFWVETDTIAGPVGPSGPADPANPAGPAGLPEMLRGPRDPRRFGGPVEAVKSLPYASAVDVPTNLAGLVDLAADIGSGIGGGPIGGVGIRPRERLAPRTRATMERITGLEEPENTVLNDMVRSVPQATLEALLTKGLGRGARFGSEFRSSLAGEVVGNEAAERGAPAGVAIPLGMGASVASDIESTARRSRAGLRRESDVGVNSRNIARAEMNTKIADSVREEAIERLSVEAEKAARGETHLTTTMALSDIAPRFEREASGFAVTSANLDVRALEARRRLLRDLEARYDQQFARGAPEQDVVQAWIDAEEVFDEELALAFSRVGNVEGINTAPLLRTISDVRNRFGDSDFFPVKHVKQAEKLTGVSQVMPLVAKRRELFGQIQELQFKARQSPEFAAQLTGSPRYKKLVADINKIDQEIAGFSGASSLKELRTLRANISNRINQLKPGSGAIPPLVELKNAIDESIDVFIQNSGASRDTMQIMLLREAFDKRRLKRELFDPRKPSVKMITGEQEIEAGMRALLKKKPEIIRRELETMRVVIGDNAEAWNGVRRLVTEDLMGEEAYDIIFGNPQTQVGIGDINKARSRMRDVPKNRGRREAFNYVWDDPAAADNAMSFLDDLERVVGSDLGTRTQAMRTKTGTPRVEAERIVENPALRMLRDSQVQGIRGALLGFVARMTSGSAVRRNLTLQQSLDVGRELVGRALIEPEFAKILLSTEPEISPSNMRILARAVNEAADTVLAAGNIATRAGTATAGQSGVGAGGRQ